ncbi:molybdenum cofactor guanylyltransferase MobA [Variovorax sp. HJSM1_2]|uniref:molybdenum cofactor guanylyltransferase MobA n=1 Tax=Variovorax sp. HJSM1_2 TaxID=3366263 RepID=UPI003BEE5BAC
MISRQDITGMVLAGGQGSRMGGLDKGLQLFHGQPLARLALDRLFPQVGCVAVNARRHLDVYATWNVPVWTDTPRAPGNNGDDYTGPLAGFLAGLSHCATPWLLTVPCDAPLFPSDLAERLSQAVVRDGANLAMAWAPATPAEIASGAPALQAQPVFCLLHKSLAASLAHYLALGGRKVRAWTAQHPCSQVAFNQPHDPPQAFGNANTLAELRGLELLVAS